MIKLSYEQQIAFNSLSIIVGNALYALTVVLFLVPSGLITCLLYTSPSPRD